VLEFDVDPSTRRRHAPQIRPRERGVVEMRVRRAATAARTTLRPSRVRHDGEGRRTEAERFTGAV
jgi:hypothetical protein